jgi:hypothetical protein
LPDIQQSDLTALESGVNDHLAALMQFFKPLTDEVARYARQFLIKPGTTTASNLAPYAQVFNPVVQGQKATVEQLSALANAWRVPVQPTDTKETIAKNIALAREKGVVGDDKVSHVFSTAPLAKLYLENGNPAPALAQIETHHPWNAALHASEALPAYVGALIGKQDMSEAAPYAGDLSKTYRAFHLFAGKAISPPGT